MLRILISVLFLLLIPGCICVSLDVALLAAEVSAVQEETSNALIKSIDRELEEDLSDEDRTGLINLKERLDYLKRGNDAVRRSMFRELSDSELRELLKEYLDYKEENIDVLPR